MCIRDRTGRAFTLVATSGDKKYLSAIEELISAAIPEYSTDFSEIKTSESDIPHDKATPSKNGGKVKEEVAKGIQSESQKPNRHFRPNEKRPPAWTGGNNFNDPETIPAFLR